jgi:hypothetical protein
MRKAGAREVFPSPPQKGALAGMHTVHRHRFLSEDGNPGNAIGI